MKPHPFRYVSGRGSLFRALCVCRDPATVSAARLPLLFSRGREAHGLCAPASRRVCLYRGAEAPERTGDHATNSEASDTYARWTLLLEDELP